MTHRVAAVGLKAGHAVDDGRVADVGVESLGRVEAEDTVLVLLFRRALAPPASEPARDDVCISCVLKIIKMFAKTKTKNTQAQDTHTLNQNQNNKTEYNASSELKMIGYFPPKQKHTQPFLCCGRPSPRVQRAQHRFSIVLVNIKTVLERRDDGARCQVLKETSTLVQLQVSLHRRLCRRGVNVRPRPRACVKPSLLPISPKHKYKNLRRRSGLQKTRIG